MMKARWRPIEWRSVCGVLWLPWKPPQLLLPVKGPYNWVLLSYYSLWFHHNMTSKSSPHLAMQVSAYLMGSKRLKHKARLVWVTEAAVCLNVNLKVNKNYDRRIPSYDFGRSRTEKQYFFL